MLTGKQVRVRFVRDSLVPQYLDTRDPQWLDVAEQLLSIFRTSQCAARGQLEAEIEDLFGDLPQPLIHNGLAKLLEDRCEFEVQAELAPEEVREAAFCAAAKKRQETLEQIGGQFSRAEIMRAVAEDLKSDITTVEASLFADLKSEQQLTGFHDITAERLLERYNVALAQALLLRSTGVEITLSGETPAKYRQLFRQIKFRRLICDIELLKANNYRIRLDGPLSLFSATQKYGLQLALFLPTLLLCKRFELTAKLRWGTERREKTFSLSHKDGLVSHEAETGAYLPAEATMFVEAFRKKITDWEISDQTEIIPLGKNIWIPDHRLVHRATGNVVLLDILGFWRRSSAERHLAMLREHAGAPFLVALSDQLNVEEAELENLSSHVIRFRNMPLPDEIAKRATMLVS
jgi:predicted nuclease of restriction endonuclease-like RecB superfamily